MSGELAVRVEADGVDGENCTTGKPAVDFIAFARLAAVPAHLADLEQQLEMMRSCLDTAVHRAMIEDLRDGLATLINWLSRR